MSEEIVINREDLTDYIFNKLVNKFGIVTKQEYIDMILDLEEDFLTEKGVLVEIED